MNMLYSVKGDMTKFVSDPTEQLLRMIVNKLVIISNEFGVEGCQRLMFYRCTDLPTHLSILRTIWDYLDLMDEPLLISDTLTIDSSINTDSTIHTMLRKMIGK